MYGGWQFHLNTNVLWGICWLLEYKSEFNIAYDKPKDGDVNLCYGFIKDALQSKSLLAKQRTGQPYPGKRRKGENGSYGSEQCK